VEEIAENTVSMTMSSGDIVRYSAPELADTADVPPTTYSDTYSFAMLVLECITEEAPFSNLFRDTDVAHARFVKKRCPPRPGGRGSKGRVSDKLWDLMERCWSIKPDDRPTMEHVHGFFASRV